LALRDAAPKIGAIRAEADGQWGVAALDLGTGEFIGFDADGIYPLASVFKVPVLVELFRQADQGILDLDERIEFRPEHRMPGSGALRELTPGFALTLRDYAMLMIILSDNSATDMVMAATGRRGITPAMRELGLERTWVSRTCGQILASLAGYEVEVPTPQQVSEINAALRAGRRGKATWCYDEGDTNNAGTPAELVRLFELIYRGQAASPEGCEAMLDILRRQQLKQRLPLYLPPNVVTAHKTGTLPGVVNDAGLMYVGEERVCAVAVLSKSGADRVAGSEAVARIGLAICEAMQA